VFWCTAQSLPIAMVRMAVLGLCTFMWLSFQRSPVFTLTMYRHAMLGKNNVGSDVRTTVVVAVARPTKHQWKIMRIGTRTVFTTQKLP
jgi:hypothetical protein